MLTILLQPVLKCMHILESTVVLILKASLHIGRVVFLILIQICNIIRDIFTALAIIGEELYHFLSELNSSISAVSNYIRSSANGGINCVLEAGIIFLKHIGNFFVNTRLHSKLLVTQVGRFIGDLLDLLRNALLLISDCAWWLITLLPRWLMYAIIAVGDFIVESITTVRLGIVNFVHIIIDDVFRLTIGIVFLILLWHNRRGLLTLVVKWSFKTYGFLRICGHGLVQLCRRIFRIQVNQTLTAPRSSSVIQRRSPLSRSSTSPIDSDKFLDATQRCVICRDREKCVLLLPCKHLCLCEECADYMFSSSHGQNCPLCRTLIDNLMSIYI